MLGSMWQHEIVTLAERDGYPYCLPFHAVCVDKSQFKKSPTKMYNPYSEMHDVWATGMLAAFGLLLLDNHIEQLQIQQQMATLRGELDAPMH